MFNANKICLMLKMNIKNCLRHCIQKESPFDWKGKVSYT